MGTLPPPGTPRLYIPRIRVNQLYRIPVFGQWAQRIGQIGYMLATPCDTTPWLWFEGFCYNIPRLAWSFLSPDLNDAIVNRAGRRHHTRRGVNFDIGDSIDAEENGIKLPGWGRWLFKLGAIAQEIGWYFLIIDATTDFLVNWTSTVYQWQGCDTGLGPWYSSNARSTVGPSPHPQRILWGRNGRGDGHLLSPGGVGVFQLQTMASAGIGFSIDAKEYPLAGPPVATIDAWLENQAGERFSRTGPSALNADGHQTTAGFANFGRPAFFAEEYQVWMMVSGGYAILDDSQISVVTGTNTGIGPGIGSNLPSPNDLHLPLPF